MIDGKNIAVAALTISILAALFAGLQSYLTFQHNRISVAPKLDWRFDYNRPGEFIFRIRLLNVGLGPAIVKNAYIYLDGEPIGALSISACSTLNEFLGYNAIDSEEYFCWVMDRGEELYMMAGEEILLYQIGPNRNDNQLWIPSERAQRLSVRAEYCSFYQDCEELE